MSMQFWGVEVKAGKPLKVKPEGGKLIHISQAALGEGKREKGSELVPLRVNINDKKFVLGSLSEEKFPQITFDLVFEKEFELSHDWKNGSVYFCGYMADHSYDEQDDDDFDSEDDDEDLPLPVAENGKVQSKTEEVKPAVSKGKEAKPESSAKPKVTVVEPKKEKSDSDDDSDDSLEDDEDMLDADSDDVSESGDDDGDSEDDDDDDDSEDDDEETPKKPVDKKRPNESASKTPVPAKKNKVDSAQKTDGKKGGHVATPYPSKKAEKAPASSKQTPKSGAQISCNSCSKKFNSDNALQSHTKAKHAAK